MAQCDMNLMHVTFVLITWITVLELYGRDMDIESVARVAISIYSTTCWCACSFSTNWTV